MITTIDSYINKHTTETQNILCDIRQLIKNIAPNATEKISYGIPTFDLNGKHLVHFAAFKKHIGFYPTSSPFDAFKKDLEGYKTSTGSIQFPLDKPIPYDLIKKITEYRVKEVL